MQSTTNYSMNLVEGTDIVNIPVQLNPNFLTIDQEMFANKQGTIGTATEVVTGTVHAVVRANVDADVFRFTATGAWTSGDTMTLDGSAVTVHLADGTAPSTGAYIIGAEVVAVVNGTLVTLLTSAAQPVAGVTSFNTRTGAVVPLASDYDASDIDYDNTLSGLTATEVQSAIDELASSIGLVEYETTEHVVGEWIDGSVLYEKTVYYTSSLPDTSSVAIPLNISNLNIVVSIDVITNSNNQALIIPYNDGSNRLSCYLDKSPAALTIVTNSSSFLPYDKTCITIRYTKTV